MRLVAKSGAEKINLGRDEHYFVESPEDGIRIYHAYPGRCLGYFHGVKSTLVAYKDRYVLPNFNEEDSLKIIDCGGNIGEFSYSFMLAYPNATMVTFEPSPFEFELLQKNHRENKNKIELVNKALGEQTGTIDFYVKSEHADSTTIEPLHYEQRIKVPLVTLDDFFKDKGSLVSINAAALFRI
jgi:FkbM family methyltransferase